MKMSEQCRTKKWDGLSQTVPPTKNEKLFHSIQESNPRGFPNSRDYFLLLLLFSFIVICPCPILGLGLPYVVPDGIASVVAGGVVLAGVTYFYVLFARRRVYACA